MTPLSSLKLWKWISLWCYSQAPSHISVDVYLNGAQISVEIVPLQMPSRTQNSWALEGKQRKRER